MKNLLLLIFGFCALGYSQDNMDAELLLNKVSDNIKSYDNIYINYAYTLKNLEEDIFLVIWEHIIQKYQLTILIMHTNFVKKLVKIVKIWVF